MSEKNLLLKLQREEKKLMKELQVLGTLPDDPDIRTLRNKKFLDLRITRNDIRQLKGVASMEKMK